MTFKEMEQAVNDARMTIKRADCFIGGMLYICSGRLRSAGVSGSVLAELKKELKDFNIATYRWKSK